MGLSEPVVDARKS